MPIDVCARQRAASNISESMLTLLRNGGKDRTGYKWGVNGFQGLMHYATPNKVYEMVHITGGEITGYVFTPVLSSVAQF